MTEELPPDLMRLMSGLEAQIRATPSAQRVELQADLHRLCERLVHEGYEVPDRLRALDALLTEAVEDGPFDNLPV